MVVVQLDRIRPRLEIFVGPSSNASTNNRRADCHTQTMFSLTQRFLPTILPVRRFSVTASVSNVTLNLTEGEQSIHAKLTEKFSPSALQVQDVSGSKYVDSSG